MTLWMACLFAAAPPVLGVLMVEMIERYINDP